MDDLLSGEEKVEMKPNAEQQLQFDNYEYNLAVD